jgi:hypothetical protein
MRERRQRKAHRRYVLERARQEALQGQDQTRNNLFEIQPSALAELSKGCTARTDPAQVLPLRPDDVSQHADPLDLELNHVARL